MFSSNQLVVLCIDDEPNILMLRQLLLSLAGYSVLTAANAEEALAAFTNHHVDLVITDQLLPGRSGTEIAAEMKRLQPQVPIVLFTGLVDLPAGTEHMDLVLTKGITPPEFLTALASLISPRSAGKA